MQLSISALSAALALIIHLGAGLPATLPPLGFQGHELRSPSQTAPPITSTAPAAASSLPYFDTYIQPERPFSPAVCGPEICDVFTETTTRTVNRANPSLVLVNQTETWKAGNTITVTSEVWMLPARETATTATATEAEAPVMTRAPVLVTATFVDGRAGMATTVVETFANS
ncbi:uncharacterized protein L3040_005314 [Drepanopeziza brunnea f. sp. 'multigermtubi']|uniref:uncharacterized protein n=1 Tax=Drepanopeziza brunnea f. sp. 'multigermtubi' TaxID=698441 RepID=UPI00239647F7|nr:hypothetical protein L3040_005314 [Drepanopeziza brunnea f. sp. 'multigermtubi']